MQLTKLNEVIMYNILCRQKWFLLLLILSVATIAPSAALALRLTDGGQQAKQAQERSAQQPSVPQDPITQLNLSPEQRQQIRAIREQSKDERAAVNRRLRETQIALEQALNAESPNEALIEQRARESGEAQAAAIRLRALTETRIRRVLTLEQINTLRQLRAQAQQARREQRLENRAIQGKAPGANGRALQNRRNGPAPGPGARRDGLPRKQRL